MKTLLPLSAAALLLAHSAFAQNSIPAPDIIGSGFDAYQKDGVQAAMTVWLKNSAIENDSAGRMQMAGGLGTLQGAYGRFTGWEIVRAVKLGESVRRVYIVAKFERGPIFFAFDCYQAAAGWTISTFDMHTKPSSIFPAAILGGQ
jgi:hypothetical protein